MKSGATETSYIHLQKHYTFPENVFVSHLPEEIKKSNHSIKILWAHHAYDQPLFLNFDHYIVDHIVSPSQWNKDQFIKYHNVPEDKITVISNGVSDIFSFSEEKTKTMIYTSVPYKGLEVLYHVIPLIHKKHPDTKFKIFSSMSLYGLKDDMFDELYEKIKKLPNVEYSSAIDQEDLVSHYQESAFFIHPNIWEETFCVSMVEAMKCGCYPIITNIGALEEVAGEKNSFVVPMDGTSTSKGYEVTKRFINNFTDTCCKALDHFDSDRTHYLKVSKIVSDYVSEKYNWEKISQHWKNLVYKLGGKSMNSESHSLTRYKLITADEAINNDDYLMQASENVLKWEESDKELSQGRTNFQIEKFIGLNSFNISVTFEHILKERRLMATGYMTKLMEMKMKVREFEYKWKDATEEDKITGPYFWSPVPEAPKSVCWYDMEELSMKHYLKDSELEIRDRLHQLEHLDKILERLIELNGGKPVTRKQFLEENADYWETRLAQQALDDLLSAQLGISGGNITAMRQASAPSIVDDRNELNNGYLPMDKLTTSQGRQEFIADLQMKVLKGFEEVTNAGLLTPKQEEVKKLEETSLFNNDVVNNYYTESENYFTKKNSIEELEEIKYLEE